MSQICPICGCKTDEIDFVSIVTNDGITVSVCDYCNKQISSLKSADTNDASGLAKIQPKVRWLDTVLAKQVEDRDVACVRMLATLRNGFPNYLSEQQLPDANLQQNVSQIYASPFVSAGTNMPVQNNNANDGSVPSASSAEVEALKKRLDKLETSFYKMKRTLLITNVVEFAVPALIMIIFAIFFFRSELWTNLSRLLYEATGGYNVF